MKQHELTKISTWIYFSLLIQVWTCTQMTLQFFFSFWNIPYWLFFTWVFHESSKYALPQNNNLVWKIVYSNPCFELIYSLTFMSVVDIVSSKSNNHSYTHPTCISSMKCHWVSINITHCAGSLDACIIFRCIFQTIIKFFFIFY